MNRATEISLLLIFAILLSSIFVAPAFAIVPQVQNEAVTNSTGNIILNVTVFHTPEQLSPPHYVDLIQVNVDGTTYNFTVEVQPTTTFTIQCDLGPIHGTPTAKVTAHCNVDGGSSPSEIQIPEFPLPIMLLTLVLALSVVVVILRKTKLKINK